MLAFYRAPDFAAVVARAEEILRFQGAGHSVRLHTSTTDRARELGLTLPVCRVIVNHAHCFATGGSFDNALPFSLSNITRVVRPLEPERVHEPTDDDVFGAYRAKRWAAARGAATAFPTTSITGTSWHDA